MRNVLILCGGLMHNPREYVSHYCVLVLQPLYVVSYKPEGFLIFELEQMKKARRKWIFSVCI